jgi:hypothetical protein
MSYELKLFRPVPGEDPLKTRYNISASPNYKGPRDPEIEDLKHQISVALTAHDPNLETVQANHAAIAKNCGVPLEEAVRAFRAFSLDPVKNTNGIHIRVDDDHIAIEITFWDERNHVQEVFKQLYGYLQLLTQNWDFVIHDPQIDRIITADEIFSETLQQYSRGVCAQQPSLHLVNAIKKQWRPD